MPRTPSKKVGSVAPRGPLPPMNPVVKTAANRIVRALRNLTPENQRRVLRATCVLMDIPMPDALTVPRGTPTPKES
jgi:hypothetical protein